MRTYIFLCLVLTLSGMNGWGQNPTNGCGTDAMHKYRMLADPVYKKQFVDLDFEIKTRIKNQANNKLQTPVYTIPVVVHVIHVGETIGTGTNISDAQIQGAINGLNDRFRNGIGAGVDVEINFCLAVRDPSGNSTTGINRVNGSGVTDYSLFGIANGLGCATGAVEDDIKALSRWPVTDYYNIWVVNSICNGQLSGYAYYPSGNVNDGAVLTYNSMMYSSLALTHEVAHGFFTYHTFEGDGGNVSCPTDTSCINNGDQVCDTPPHKQGDCGISNPCTGNGIWDNSRYNYMSYCWPSNADGRFTQGQKDRMRAAAAIYPRLSLSSSLGCNPVTANDAGIEKVVYPIKTTYTSNCSNLIVPIVELKNYGANALTSVTINYKLDNNSLNNYLWNGNLASGASINVILSSISISPGNHEFLAFTTNPNGLSDGYVLNDSGNVILNYEISLPFELTKSVLNAACYGDNNGSATIIPVTNSSNMIQIIENWEGSTDWTIDNGLQTNKWYIGDALSGTTWGAKSIYISDNNNTNTYTTNSSSIVHFYKDFVFPPGATNITIKFAWKGYGQSGLDYLQVYLEPNSVNPAAGSQLTGTPIGTYNLQSTFTYETITGLDANAGSTKRLIFSWRNDGSGGTQPAAAIENITVSYNITDTGPYNYFWNTTPIQTTSKATNLSAGNYTATVTDNSGCTAVMGVSISQPAAISLTTTQTNVACNGNNGSASVNVTGGTLTLPDIMEDWEAVNTWTLVNGTQTNKWHVGTATSNGGTQSIYVSDDNSSHAYNDTAMSVVHFYKDFTFPANATNIKIRFDWKGYGAQGGFGGAEDFLVVGLVPTDTTPVAGMPLFSGQIGELAYFLDSTFTTDTITGLDTIAGLTKRLVFSWINSAWWTGGTQPAAIDNIVVSYDALGVYHYLWNTTPVQTTATASNLSAGSYSITVTDQNGCTGNASVTIVSVSITLGGATTFCQSDSVMLVASSANSYLWSNGATTQSIKVITSGNFYVTVTDVSGCSATSSAIVVTVNPPPPIPVISVSGTLLTSSSAIGNQWYLNANSIPGATSQNYSSTQNGIYTVIVTDSNGCSSISAPYVFTTTSLQYNLENNSIIIIPNPNNGIFHIEIKDLQFSEIKIFNTFGEVIYEPEIRQSDVDLSGQSKGVYFIQMRSENTTVTKKIIIQ